MALPILLFLCTRQIRWNQSVFITTKSEFSMHVWMKITSIQSLESCMASFTIYLKCLENKMNNLVVLWTMFTYRNRNILDENGIGYDECIVVYWYRFFRWNQVLLATHHFSISKRIRKFLTSTTPTYAELHQTFYLRYLQNCIPLSKVYPVHIVMWKYCQVKYLWLHWRVLLQASSLNGHNTLSDYELIDYQKWYHFGSSMMYSF